MTSPAKRICLAIELAILLVMLSACGGGGGSSTNSNNSTNSNSSTSGSVGSNGCDGTDNVPGLTTLYCFGSAQNDGYTPNGGLIIDAAGDLFGTTASGGTNDPGIVNIVGSGTAFELKPNGSGGYTETILYSFGATTDDGIFPGGALIMDASGDLFGTTSGGGSFNGGTVFELKPNGSDGYTETVLYSFGVTGDGFSPKGALIMDASGDLFGTTSGGGSFNGGTVFELKPNGSGGYTETVIYSLGGGSYFPEGTLIMDTSGDLFGTTLQGGAYNGTYDSEGNAKSGTVFELTPDGSGGYTESVIHSFGATNDGYSPQGSLVMDAAGNLFGTTEYGADNSGGFVQVYNYGTVFELTPDGSGGYTERVVYNFTNYSFGFSDGSHPKAGLIIDASGDLFGTTFDGGGYYTDKGTVFELKPDGSGGYNETLLNSFGDFNGDHGNSWKPDARLVMDTSGKLFGMSSQSGSYNSDIRNFAGTVFEIQ